MAIFNRAASSATCSGHCGVQKIVCSNGEASLAIARETLALRCRLIRPWRRRPAPGEQAP